MSHGAPSDRPIPRSSPNRSCASDISGFQIKPQLKMKNLHHAVAPEMPPRELILQISKFNGKMKIPT
jgi:hypothetical protein